MGKEELLDALATLQDETSVMGISRYIPIVHEALADIQRKRWRFLEDICSVILRQVWSLVVIEGEVLDEFETVKNKISTTEAIELSLAFVEPLIQSTTTIAGSSDDFQEVTSQKGTLVAALLHLFAQIPGSLDVGDSRSRLVSDILACGIQVHVIFSTLRFREELVECRRTLLPCHESDSETESEVDSDDETGSFEESEEFDSEDSAWIVEQVAKVWGLTRFQYFLRSSGQEYSFSAWSYRGIGNFIHALLGDLQSHPHALSAVVSPSSWLFQVAAYAHYMIHSEDLKERFRGLEIVRVAARYCPIGKLKIKAEREIHCSSPQSFRQQAASFRDRDWISPLIQVITNAMVLFPEPTDRSATLAVLKELIFAIEMEDRFWLLRSLILKCPYGNVAAALVDFVRGDAVKAWSSLETFEQSPFTTVEIRLLLQDVLSQAAERDLVLHADLIASCLSLQRFLYIRDKSNVTGIRTKSRDCSIWDVLLRIKKRLQLKTEETTSDYRSLSIDNDCTHLMVLEAALGSALELYD